MSRASQRVIGALGGALFVAVGGVVSVAHAAPCATFSVVVFDHANVSEWTRDSGTCIGVRHYYAPVWSANNYWTNWHGGGNTSYSTPDTPVLQSHQTKAC